VQLAAAADIPYPTLAGIENGDQNGSTRLPSLALALQVRPEWLETGKGPMDAGEMATESQSQPVGLDPDTLSWTVKALRKRDPKRDWISFMIECPNLFIEAYRLYAERTSDEFTELQLGIKLADLVPLQPRDGTGDEREKNVSAPSASRRGVGKDRKRKA